MTPCYCTMVGAWVLAQCVEKYGFTPGTLSAAIIRNQGQTIAILP